MLINLSGSFVFLHLLKQSGCDIKWRPVPLLQSPGDTSDKGESSVTGSFKRARVMSDEQIKRGLIRIAHLRFRAFEARFQRAPGMHDPLFFDETCDIPVQSDPATARRQLIDAALALGIEPEPVLEFLDHAAERRHRDREPSGDTRGRNPHPTRAGRVPPRSRRGRFELAELLMDRRVRRRFRVTPDETRMLSEASFLGRANRPKDLALILKVIRARSDRPVV